MSLARLVYYSAVASGWAAFVAWLLAERLILGSQSFGVTVETVLSMALVGAWVAAALNLVAGMTNPHWRRHLRRVAQGFLGGAIGGAFGGLAGAAFYSAAGLPRTLGWIIMGLGVGAAEGVYERSTRKLRNGLVGGTLGGLLGGLLFDWLATSGGGLFSRAVGFVILGLSVGALIGLTHVMLKEAWLTVLDGYRPGRQLILTQPVTFLGRGDHLLLPFLGYSGKDLESEHLRISRRPDGTYLAEDNHSRIGTRINGQLISAPVVLRDGDLIRLGTNIVRFNQRHRGALAAQGPTGSEASGRDVGRIPSPPVPPTYTPTYGGMRSSTTPSQEKSLEAPPPSPPRPAPRIPPPPPPPA